MFSKNGYLVRQPLILAIWNSPELYMKYPFIQGYDDKYSCLLFISVKAYIFLYGLLNAKLILLVENYFVMGHLLMMSEYLDSF